MLQRSVPDVTPTVSAAPAHQYALRPYQTLASAISMGYAQGVAEDFARTLGARALIAKDASWRLEEPTPKQLSKLRYLRIPVGDIRTRGEASDLISAALAQGAA